MTRERKSTIYAEGVGIKNLSLNLTDDSLELWKITSRVPKSEIWQHGGENWQKMQLIWESSASK